MVNNVGQRDWHNGPLAHQEVLIGVCPTDGVRTGASFARDGVTGFVVDRLPAGRQNVENGADHHPLAVFLNGVARVQNLDRHAVRSAAEREFSSTAIVEGVIAALDQLRAVIC